MYGDLTKRYVTDRYSRYPQNAYHNRVLDWKRRVLKNGGGNVSTKTLVAVNRFYRYILNRGLETKMKTLSCFVPDNLIACNTPLINKFGNDPWTNNNFVDGDLTIEGLKGNASNKSLDTGVSPTVCFQSPLSSAGMTLYVRNGISEMACDMGYSGVGEFPGFRLYPSWVDDNTYFHMWKYDEPGGALNTINGNWQGYLSGNRVAQNRMDIYKASSAVGHTSIANTNVAISTSAVNFFIAVFAVTNGYTGSGNGSYYYYSSKRLSFAAVHDGLTSDESALLYEGIQNLRKELGGGWV